MTGVAERTCTLLKNFTFSSSGEASRNQIEKKTGKG